MTSKLFILLILLFSHSISAEVIDKRTSLYQTISITENGNLLCMEFKSRSWGALEQSCIDTSNPDRLVFDYYQGIAISTRFLIEQPEDILVIGMGGGVIPMFLSQEYPDANIESVEIDPVVADFAKQYFNYDDTSSRLSTHIMDGRVYVKRAASLGKQYDLIVLDAFGGDYIPEHLMTREFYQELSNLLSGDGLFVSNTFSDSMLYHHESQTLYSVFSNFYQLKISNREANRVVMARKGGMREPIPSTETSAIQKLHNYGVDALHALSSIETSPEWDRTVPILTDQYSPVNILKLSKE